MYIFLHMVKKFTTHCKITQLIIILTVARNWTLSWASCIHSKSTHIFQGHCPYNTLYHYELSHNLTDCEWVTTRLPWLSSLPCCLSGTIWVWRNSRSSSFYIQRAWHKRAALGSVKFTVGLALWINKTRALEAVVWCVDVMTSIRMTSHGYVQYNSLTCHSSTSFLIFCHDQKSMQFYLYKLEDRPLSAVSACLFNMWNLRFSRRRILRSFWIATKCSLSNTDVSEKPASAFIASH